LSWYFSPSAQSQQPQLAVHDVPQINGAQETPTHAGFSSLLQPPAAATNETATIASAPKPRDQRRNMSSMLHHSRGRAARDSGLVPPRDPDTLSAVEGKPEPPRVSGALACGLREVLVDRAGEDAVARALARCDDDIRQRWQNATHVGWVPIEVLERVFGEVAASLGRNVADLHTEVARVSIERTMRTLWRVLLRLTTDQALISRTPVIFAKSYNRGRLLAVIPSSGHAEVNLVEWRNPPEWPLRATRIGIETVLRIAGRNDVEVSYSRTNEGATYAASWR
jgi:hypothetical protein